MTRLLALLALVPCGCSDPMPATRATIPLDAKTRAQVSLTPAPIYHLERVVKANKGKVVVLDIWFLGCAPCVKKWPTFVALHEEFADTGLVCMSVDVEIDENEKFEKVEAFLKEKNARFPNFIVKDTVANRDKWQEANDANATPSYVVYDRGGKRVPVPLSIKPDEMRDLVKKLLAVK